MPIWVTPQSESDDLLGKRLGGIRKSWSKIYGICKVSKAISPTHEEKTALFRRFLSLCLIWHPYSIEGDEIEKQQKKCS